MGRIVEIPQEIDDKLSNLARNFKDEMCGVLVCTGADTNTLVAGALFLTGFGRPGKIATEPGHIQLVQKLLEARPDVRLVQFRTVTEESASNSGPENLIAYMSHYQDRLKKNEDFLGMVVTPREKFLVGSNNLEPVVSKRESNTDSMRRIDDAIARIKAENNIVLPRFRLRKAN